MTPEPDDRAPLAPSARPGPVAEVEVLRLEGGVGETRADTVVVEEPLEIRVDGETVAVTMRTPGADGDLVLGFLLAEGLIAAAVDVGSVAHCGRPGEEGFGNVVDVRSSAGRRIDPDRVLDGQRWSTSTSSCGVCGRRSIDDLLARCAPVGEAPPVGADRILGCMDRLARLQPVFSRTGGLHAAAAFTGSGDLLASAEDVGRHNAVDKVVGALLRRGALAEQGDLRPLLLTVSGRTSFEVVQKAAAAGVPVVASVSAPSSLAVELARSTGITLVGFARGDRMNVYTHASRVARS